MTLTLDSAFALDDNAADASVELQDGDIVRRPGLNADSLDSALDVSEWEIAAAAVHGATMPVDPADFLRVSLRFIVEAASDLDRRGQIVSATDIVALLRSWDTLRMLKLDGGLDLVVELVAYRPLYCSLEYHADVVRRAARLRRLAMHALGVHIAAARGESADEALRELAEMAR